MQSINTVIKTNTVLKQKTIVNKYIKNNCYRDITKLYVELDDLVGDNQQFKAWYCQMFYKLGRDQVLRLAGQARSNGLQPQKYFSQLLKLAVVNNNTINA